MLNARKVSRNKSDTEPASAASSAQKPAFVSQSNQRLYISHDATVWVYDLKNFEPVAPVKVDFFAHAIERQGDYIYFEDPLSILINKAGDLSAINSFEFSDFDDMFPPVPNKTRIRIAPDGKKMYIGVLGWGKAATSGVLVVDLVNKKQTKILDKNAVSTGLIDMSKDGHFLYVPVWRTLTVVKTADDREYKNIDFGKEEYIVDLIAEDNYMVYLVTCHMDEDSSRDYKFRVVDVEKGTIKTLPLTADRFKIFHLLDDSAHKNVYIIGNEKLVRFNTVSNSIVDEKPFKYDPFPSCITPDGNFIISSITDEKKAVIYDIKKQTVVKEIPFKETLYDIIAK
jgi:hypothetical protein